MDVCRDYEELFAILNTSDIRYLMVGGQAAIFYSEPRYTKDMDVWIPPELNDPEAVFRALKHFGAPLHGMTVEDFRNKKLIFQIGVPPVRIDIMMSVPGVSAKRAWRTRRRGRYGKTDVKIIDIRELIRAKKEANRPMDRLDVERLVDRARRFGKKLRRREPIGRAKKSGPSGA